MRLVTASFFLLAAELVFLQVAEAEVRTRWRRVLRLILEITFGIVILVLFVYICVLNLDV